MKALRLFSSIIAFLLLPSCGKDDPLFSMQDCNVILIIIDTLRADHLGCFGYEADVTPNLDRLAKKSSLFLNAYSPSSWTRSAVASILTSKLPLEHGIFSESKQEILHPDFLTLQEFYSRRGYTTGLIYTNPHYEFGLNRNFDHLDYTKDGSAELIYGKAENWVKEQEKMPFFLIIHNNDPHDVYAYHPHFSRYPADSPFRELQPYFPPRRIGEKGKTYKTDELIRLEGKDLEEMIGNYDDEIRYLDHHIGQFIHFLESSGLLNNTLLIITADHGEEFLDHGGYWHGLTLYNELIHVPLIMYWPGLKSQRIEEKVSTLDIFPTLVDLCGEEGMADTNKFSGRSLAPFLSGKSLKSQAIFSGTAFRDRLKYSLIVDDYKIIRYADGEFIGLYNIAKDPKETRSLENEKLRENMDKMLNILLELKTTYQHLSKDFLKDFDIDNSTLEALRELGYF